MRNSGINGRRRVVLAGICLLMTGLFCACSGKQVSKERLRDLEYTVLSEEKLPEELAEVIESRKELPFKLTYQDDGYLYICQGFGQQKTGGYSIQARDIYETENAIYFSVSLIGPLGEEPVTQLPSFPYIVVKTEYQDKTIVFD